MFTRSARSAQPTALAQVAPDYRWVPILLAVTAMLTMFILPGATHAQDIAAQVSAAATTTLAVLRALFAFVAIGCVVYWLWIALAFFAQGLWPSLWMGVSSTVRLGVIISLMAILGVGGLFAMADSYVGGFAG